jgi:hypothetical protein
MPQASVATKFFEFSQDASGGSFDIDDAKGIGPSVWVEALSADDACLRAQSLGIYFDGCESGRDCDCCGDRWYRTCHDGNDAPEIDPEYDFDWHDTVYVHRLDGAIERIGKPQNTELPAEPVTP